MKTNKMVDKVAEDAVLAEDMLAKMEQIDENKVDRLSSLIAGSVIL